ncbi:MAG: murein biosynthesis integral membrane protein MurJ [Actinomycetota bacterium]
MSTTDTPRLVRASAAVALGTLLSRLTGLARVAVLAYALGRATLADGYNLANTTPNIMYELLLGGVLSATLVPLFVDHLARRDDRATSAIFTVTMTALVAVTALGMAGAPWIARAYAIDATGETRDAQIEVVTFLVRCFLPQICFYGLATLATAALHARRRYLAAAYTPVLNNVIVVCALLAFTRVADGPQEAWVDVERVQSDAGLLLLLGLGTTAGIAVMALALLPALAAAGVRVPPVFAWRHAAVRRLVRLSGWTAGYVVANQLALLFVLVLAKTGEAGDVSAYQYAFMFFQLPHGLFAVSLMTTTTPELAYHAAADDRGAFDDHFGTGLRLLLLVMIPSAVLLGVLAQPAVSVLARGGFSAHDAAVTADVLQAFAIGLVPFSAYLFTLRVFYAHQDTRTPFVVNAIENGVNIALALALFPALGVRGLALAYSGAYLAAAVIAGRTCSRRFGPLAGRRTVGTGARALVAAGALAAVAAPLAGAIGSDGPGRAAVATGAGATAGALAYVAVLVVAKTEDLAALARAVTRRRRTPGRDV